MDSLMMVLGFLLLFLGVPISVITTIVFAIKKRKVKIPAICIPVSLVLSFIFLMIGGLLYSNTDEYKESSAKREAEIAKQEKQKEKEKKLEEEKLAKQKEEKEKKEKEKEKKSKKNKEKKEKKKEKKSQDKEKPKAQENQETQEANNEAESKPQPVSVESSVVLYYLDLYENFENYNGQYVTISAPINSVDEDSVFIREGIDGATGMIDIALLEPRSDLNSGDFITVTGRVDGKTLGCLYLKDANISQTGDASAQIYSQQKQEYEALSAQRAQQEVDSYKSSCEALSYEDILRNPDSYKDRNCVVSGTVNQIIEGWFGSYSIFVSDGAGNIWGCVYSYKDGEPHLLQGDGVTIYGKCNGTDTNTNLLGQQVTMPRIDVEYIN